MTKNEVFNYIVEIVHKENSKNNDHMFDIVTGMDQIIIDKQFNNEYDIRLNDQEYLNNSITILGKDNGTLLGKATIFITGYDTYSKEFFWEYDEVNNILVKKYLSEYKDIIGDLCLTLGYAQISDNIREKTSMFHKSRLISIYVTVLQEILRIKEIFVHVEPCGFVFLTNEQLSAEKLAIEGGSAYEILGRVYPESIVSYKVAEKYGLHKMHNLFHHMTLGPVFFSRTSCGQCPV